MSNDYKVITNIDPHSVASEQYRKLRTSIDFSSSNNKMQVINLTSTFPGEGKTVTCLNLATVYAQTKKKVLVIDMDLRKPKIHKVFNLSNKGGVSDYVMNNHTISKSIDKIDVNLDLLVAGEKVPFPSEVLVSDKIKEMMEEIRTIYDIVLINCPPMTAAADASIISNFCDGTLFVVGSRKTNREVAKSVLKDLKNTGANVIGGVLTRVQKRDSSYGMDYYYGED